MTVCAVLTTIYKSDPVDLWELALDSLLSQAGVDLRIYVCADGPLTDAQEALLSRRADSLYRLIRNPKNLGLAASLNRLIDELEDEEFVFRMDGDDISLPGRCEAQVRYLQANPDVALVGCQAWDISDDGAVLGERSFPVDPAACRKLLARQNPVLHPTYCLRREVLRDPGVRYPEAYLTEDLAFLVVLAEKGVGFANIPERLFQWRTGANFFARRSSLRRARAELTWYGRAVRAVQGPYSLANAYPLIRFAIRCLPGPLVVWVYRLKLRDVGIGRPEPRLALGRD